MLTTLNPSKRQFLNNLDTIQQRMQAAQQQISTGKRLNTVSDAPDQITTLLQARADLSSSQQIQSNLGRVKLEVDAGEQALETSVQLFDRVQTLGAAGNSGTQTAASRAALAQELGSVLGEMTGLAGTTVEGRHIFSGDSDQTPPYVYNPAQANPIGAYLGAPATRLTQHPNGTTFSISETAQTIFDSADPTTNVFQSINTLRSALLANDDAAVQSAMDALPKVAGYLNQQLSYYGTVQNRVSEATDYGQTQQVQLKAQISGLEDADLTSAILELNQSQLQQQAALQAEGQLPRKSLFDFLA